MAASISRTLCPKAESFIGSFADIGRGAVYGLLRRTRALFWHVSSSDMMLQASGEWGIKSKAEVHSLHCLTRKQQLVIPSDLNLANTCVGISQRHFWCASCPSKVPWDRCCSFFRISITWKMAEVTARKASWQAGSQREGGSAMSTRPPFGPEILHQNNVQMLSMSFVNPLGVT